MTRISSEWYNPILMYRPKLRKVVDSIVLTHKTQKHTFEWPEGKGPLVEEGENGFVVSFRDKNIERDFFSTLQRLGFTNNSSPNQKR